MNTRVKRDDYVIMPIKILYLYQNPRKTNPWKKLKNMLEKWINIWVTHGENILRQHMNIPREVWMAAFRCFNIPYIYFAHSNPLFDTFSNMSLDKHIIDIPYTLITSKVYIPQS